MVKTALVLNRFSFLKKRAEMKKKIKKKKTKQNYSEDKDVFLTKWAVLGKVMFKQM